MCTDKTISVHLSDADLEKKIKKTSIMKSKNKKEKEHVTRTGSLQHING